MRVSWTDESWIAWVGLEGALLHNKTERTGTERESSSITSTSKYYLLFLIYNIVDFLDIFEHSSYSK